MSRRAFILPLLTVFGLPLAGCTDRSIPTIPAPSVSASFAKEPGEPETKKLFKEYVAMGSSIAAGFMSGGINDSTQRQSFARILAASMGTMYHYPSLNMPGCSPPIANAA